VLTDVANDSIQSSIGDVVHRNSGTQSALSLGPSTSPHTSPIIEALICWESR
jgi:hypothetical protein